VTADNSESTGEQTEKGANLSEDVSGDQIDEKGNRSQLALGESHCSKDETSLHSSDGIQVDLPLTDVQSDTAINGIHHVSGDSPNTTEICSTSSTTENSQHSKHDSSPTAEPSVAVVKQSLATAKQAPEKKRKQSHFPPFIDTHCHLDYVFDRYHHRGTFNGFTNRLSYPTNFEGCISTFCDPAAFSSIGAWRELLSEPNVWGTFGIHPHNAKYYHTSGLEDKVLEGLQHPKCVAFGEIGLDYSDHSPSDVPTQKDILRQQLQLVVPFGKPVVLHCRDAEQDLFEILTQHLPRDWFIHLHCFTGEPHVATQFLNEFPNLYLGVCGNVTNPRQVNMRTVVTEMPLERLLIETDAPYHVPSNLPKAAGWCRNSHPALAFYVAKEMARLRKEDLVDVLKTVRTNTRTLYGV
jgi:TatD DNase family protein